MKYMLDTNICIYIIKKNPKKVLEKFTLFSLGDIGISSITAAELMHGVEKSTHVEKNKAALEEFLLPLEIAAFDENAAQHYGHIRAHLERAGTPIGPLDLIIAAHALHLKAVLITNNQKEFSRVPQLKIENWA
ncbi:MAG: type II toxin-antitoxin system VapC family toxin [Legionellales bacterium]|jgi:tRNA(fMet)-specific endonuclease VapC